MGGRHLKKPKISVKKSKLIQKKQPAEQIDEKERNKYFKGIFESKIRRKQGYLENNQEVTKIEKCQQRSEIRENRKKQIELLKILLKIQDQSFNPKILVQGKQGQKILYTDSDGQHVHIVRQDNVIVRTIFY